MKNFSKGGHLQLQDSFFLHQRCLLIEENTVFFKEKIFNQEMVKKNK